MTGNPRACRVATAVLESLTDDVRRNIVEMGDYAKAKYRELQKEYPTFITAVEGTGLLYAVGLDEEAFAVVATEGAEYVLRKQGLGVIHGGKNALRFTPHFNITRDEMDMQVEFVRALLKRLDNDAFRALAPRLVTYDEPTSDSAPSGQIWILTLKGHIFDKKAINDILNAVEDGKGTARMLAVKLGDTKQEATQATLEISGFKDGSLELDKLRSELKRIEASDIRVSFARSDRSSAFKNAMYL